MFAAVLFIGTDDSTVTPAPYWEIDSDNAFAGVCKLIIKWFLFVCFKKMRIKNMTNVFSYRNEYPCALSKPAESPAFWEVLMEVLLLHTLWNSILFFTRFLYALELYLWILYLVKKSVDITIQEKLHLFSRV